MAKRRLRRILLLLGVPAALFLLAILLADTAWVKRRILAAADRRLRAELGLTVTADASSFSLTRLAVSLRDIRVAPVEAGASPIRVFTASEIFVDLAWSTLLTGDLRVQEIRVVGPFLDLAPSVGREPRPAPEPTTEHEPSSTAKPFSFEVRKFVLIEGAVTVGGHGGSLVLSLGDILIDLRRAAQGPGHVGSLRSSGGRLSFAGRSLEIRALQADLVIDERRIEIERALLATPLSRIEIKGRVGDYRRDPVFDLALSAGLSLEEAAGLFPSLPPTRGSLAVDATLRGTADDAIAAARLRTDSLLIEGYPEAALRLSVESDLRGSLDLKELVVESAGATLSANGLVRAPGDGESRFDLVWSGLDLSLLSSVIPDFPRFDALSHGRVRAAWREYRLDSLRASGQVSFRSISARSPLPVEGSILFTADRDGLDVSRAELRAAGTSLSLAGRLGWERTLQARFEVLVPDLAEAVLAASDLAPHGIVEDLSGIGGRVRLEGTVAGTTSEPVLRAELEASDLAWNGLAVPALEAALSLDGPALDITRLRADLASGTLEARLALHPPTPEAPGRPGWVFDGRATGSGLDLAFLAPVLPGTPLSGLISFEAEGRGPVERPAFSVRLDGRNIGAAGALIPILSLTAASDGILARARLEASLFPDAHPPVIVEAELPLFSPYPLQATLLTEGLVLEDFLDHREGPGPGSARPPLPLNSTGSFLVPLENLAGSRLTLAFRGLNLGSLAALTGIAVPPGTGGEADLDVRASGDPTDPAALTVEGEIVRLAFFGNLPPLESRGPVRFALRDGVFELDDLILAIGDSTLRASGSVRGLPADPVIEAQASIDIDAALVPPGLINASVAGRLKLGLSVDGPALHPAVRGQGELAGGYFQPRDFPLVVSDLSLKIELRDRSIHVTDGKGLANGGLLELAGRIDLGEGMNIGRVAFDTRLEGFSLNYPPGLVTLSDGRARLEGDGKGWLLRGDLRILQGSFREDIFPGAELLGFSSLPLLPEMEGPSEAARNFRLDITAATVEPIIVRNNMADFGLEADLRVTGSMAAPALTGRVWNVSMGEIVFGERRYTLETLRLEFLGQPVPDPQIEITAHTRLVHRMEGLEVRLRLSGPASDLKFSLTSTPPRSSQDLSLLLLTGRSLDEVRGSALDTLKGQMILHFMSPLLSPVTRSLERFLGIDDVSFAPMSIASEEDPGARLTFIKNLTKQLSLTYSIDVTQTQRQSWLLDYSLSRRFVLQAFDKDDGSYGGSFKHTVPLGEEKEEKAGEADILAGIELEATTKDGNGGGTGLDRRLLEKAWKPLRAGRTFRISDLGRATENLDRLYRKQGYLDATVTPVVKRDEAGDGGRTRVTVVFVIEPKEPASLVFRGDRLPGKIRKKVLAAWTGRLPEAANLAMARRIVSGELMRRRYYRAEVGAEVERGEVKIYAIRVDKKGRYAVRGFAVAGGGVVPESVVRKALSDFPLAESRGLWNIVNAPRLALRSVERAYRERGYLKAAVEVRRLEADDAARAVDIVLGVDEGPLAILRSLSFESRGIARPSELRESVEALGLAEGRPYNPAKAVEGRTAVLNLYRGKGHQDAEVSVSLTEGTGETAGGQETGFVGVSLTYRIDEGPRHVISSVEVEGQGRTRKSLIRGASGLKPGQPMTSEGLARGQKRIYDTRVFRSVNVESEPEGGNSAGEDGGEGVDGEVRERVNIGVRKMPPVTLAYGLRYNSEVKLEALGEVDLRSPFGVGLAGLLAGRYNKRERDARFSVESNYLFGARFNLLSTVYAKREIRELFTSDEAGLTVQSRFELPSQFNISALFRRNRIHTYDPAAPGGSPVEEKVVVSEIGAVLLRDTRNDLLDPKRGSFLSLSLTWSPSFLPTEMPYISVFGQYQRYLPFGPGLVWAAAGRVGLADAFGRGLVASKRFFAGGGTSIRGFEQDRVGPIDPLLGVPAGGAAVVVINQELRFPVFGPVSGVVFYDLGAVYPTLRVMRLDGLRHGLGVGLRLKSPIGLLRFDYGLNPWSQAGEKRSVVYLSIGQAY